MTATFDQVFITSWEDIDDFDLRFIGGVFCDHDIPKRLLAFVVLDEMINALCGFREITPKSSTAMSVAFRPLIIDARTESASVYASAKRSEVTKAK